jgi:hypothetical protein
MCHGKKERRRRIIIIRNGAKTIRVDFVIMFYKNVVLYEIYSKILVTEYFLQVSVGQNLFFFIFHIKP